VTEPNFGFVPTPRRWRLAAMAMVCLAFAVSQLIAYKLGIIFLSYDPGYWQYLEPVMLTKHLAQSLFYLHMQPPLMNLALGLWMKIPLPPPDAAHWIGIWWGYLREETPATLFKLMGLGIGLATLLVMLDLGIPVVLATAATIVYVMSPEQVLYENWLYNTCPCEFLMTFAALCLVRFIRQNRTGWGLAFLVSLALMVWLNSQYQLIWYVAIVAVLFILEPQRFAPLRKAAFAVGAATALLYLKNFMLFGAFTTSTWFGMNLSAVTVSALDPGERSRLVESGTLSRFALIGPWSSLKDYGIDDRTLPHTGVPVLDRPRKEIGGDNYNNLAYIAISKDYGRNARWVLLHRPAAYLHNVWWTYRFHLQGASVMVLFRENLDRAASWIGLYGRALATIRVGEFQISPIFAFGFPLLWGISAGWLYTRWRLRRTLDTEELMVLMMLGSILYVTAVTVLFTNNDQNRMRVPIDTYYLTLATFFAWKTVVAARMKVSARRPTF
jgi:hypothetical protein